LSELLPVYDGLERGLAIETDDVAGMREGIGLTLKELLRIAGNNGLVQVDPLGEALNPELHHAVSVVDAPGHKPDTVVNVLQKGYVLNDRLLRPGVVVVDSGNCSRAKARSGRGLQTTGMAGIESPGPNPISKINRGPQGCRITEQSHGQDHRH
jgi:hypothetical protein